VRREREKDSGMEKEDAFTREKEKCKRASLGKHIKNKTPTPDGKGTEKKEGEKLLIDSCTADVACRSRQHTSYLPFLTAPDTRSVMPRTPLPTLLSFAAAVC
jgi:hypothetical protein